MADIKNSAVELIGNTTLADLVEEEQGMMANNYVI